MNIILNPKLENLLQKQLTSGKYASPDQVIEEALHLLDKRNQYDHWVEEIREKIDLAAAQLDQGNGIDGKIAINQLREQLHQAKEA